MVRKTIVGESYGAPLDADDGIDCLGYGTLSFILTADDDTEGDPTDFTFTEALEGDTTFTAVDDGDLVCQSIDSDGDLIVSDDGVFEIEEGGSALVGYVGRGRVVKVAVGTGLAGTVHVFMTERRMAD